MIPAGFIAIWPYSLATIPSGWGVATELMDRFPKGAVGEPGVQYDGFHYHTSPAHSHYPLPHAHSVQLAQSTAGGKNAGSTSSGGPADNHGHRLASDPLLQVTGGLLSAVNAVYSSVYTEPKFRKVIFIKALTSVGGVPNGAVVLTDDTSFVNNTGKWKGVYIADGANGTVSIVDKFLKGAGSGQDADVLSDLGTDTHNHTINHNHTETGHNHPPWHSGSPDRTTDYETASGTADAVRDHTHLIYFVANVMGWAGTPVSTYSEHEPYYKKLLPIQNLSGHVVTVKNMIGFWVGALADVPKMLSVCDGVLDSLNMSDVHLKLAVTVGQIGSTGGSTSHTHSDSHYHTGGSHTHGISQVEFRSASNNAYNDGHKLPAPHSHSVLVNNAGYADWSTTNTTADANLNDPAYSTVAFVKITKVLTGGSFLLAFS